MYSTDTEKARAGPRSVTQARVKQTHYRIRRASLAPRKKKY